MIGPALGAALGAAFFLWVAGWRVIDPAHISWVMQGDWRFQFLGWHFFRREPWHWPPGLVEGLHHTSGTSIGYTDSIPLAAFLLKPFEGWLPMPMQYLGLWLLLCFVLQGMFGALIVRAWTRSITLQALGATLFVLSPALLNRGVHTALCAHWLVLWALWLALRPARDRVTWTQMIVIGVVAGLVHPYLAAMTLVVLAAIVVREAPESGHWRAALASMSASMIAVVAVWWASGLFLLPAGDLAREGLASFSMNLLGPLTPLGWSRFVPALPAASPERAFEGFQYLGAGVIALILAALPCASGFAGGVRWRRWAPLLLVCGAMGVYALGPIIRFGGTTVLDYSWAWPERWSIFRVTGRFFWPASYLLLALALGVIIRRLPARVATSLVAVSVAVQAIDLQPGHRMIRAFTSSRAFEVWDAALTSPLWARVLPHYQHMVMVLPAQCGAAAAPWEAVAFLAGLHGLTFNGGEQARWSPKQDAAYCQGLRDRIVQGRVDDGEIYIVFRDYLPHVRSNAPSLVCGEIDRLPICVTPRSYQGWRDVASLQ